MSRIHLKLYFFISAIYFVLIPSLGASNNKLFYDAVRAEASGDLVKAVDVYCKIAEYEHSANLHANLANLYFKLEDYARTILHLRKAIWLDPENREHSTNLAFAMKMGGVEAQTNLDLASPFSVYYQTYWLIALNLLFWIGIFLGFSFIQPSIRTAKVYVLGAFWIAGLFFLGWGWYQSNLSSSNLNREVIAVSPTNQEDNLKEKLALRVFAGSGSEANTRVPLGSSLFLDLDDNSIPRLHTSPTGDKWFLVRSASGTNKGWVREGEIEPILDLPIK
jgi:tetratricopeptide (TPR) repeat protein